MFKRRKIFIKSIITLSAGIVCLTGSNSYGQIGKQIEEITIHSKILDEDRTVSIALPPEVKNEKYPVLYLLDGDYNIKMVSGIVDYLSKCELIPEMIIAGIGNTERARDMTPSKSTIMPKSGGAEKFYKFIKTELIPSIEKNYPASSEKILQGHSLGGLFTLYSLIKAPDIFSSYIAVSPSIQWNDFEYPPIIEKFFQNQKELKGFLFMSFADEGNGGAFRRLNELYMNILPNLSKDFEIICKHYPENNHITVLPAALTDALIAYYKNK